MEYLKVWVSFRKALEEYSDAEKGRLFDAMLAYADNGEEPHFTGNERYIWAIVKQNIDNTRDTSEKRRTAGASGGSANGSKQQQTEANDNKVEQAETKAAYKDKEKKDKDKEKKSHTDDGGYDFDSEFELFWALYPRKVAKQDALKAWKKLLPHNHNYNYELLKAIMAGLKRWKQSDEWQRDEGRYIPYPATWLNGRRWEDEVKPAKSGPQLHAHDFQQRDYSGVSDEMMAGLAEELAAEKASGGA